MRKIILFLAFLVSIGAQGQIAITIDGANKITATGTTSATAQIQIAGIAPKIIEGMDKLCPSATQNLTYDTVDYKIDCTEKTIEFCNKNNNSCTTIYWHNKKYHLNPQNQVVSNPALIPVPSFLKSSSSNIIINSKKNKNRYLIIDASSDISQKNNTKLYIRDTGKSNQFKEVHCLPANASMSIFIKDYVFDQKETIEVNISGINYQYQYDIKSFYSPFVDTATNNSASGITNLILSSSKPSILQTYLESIYAGLSGRDHLNVNDLNTLQKYKDTLTKAVSLYIKNGNSLTSTEITVLNNILSWYPNYVSLTPFSVSVPDVDEVEVKLSLKKEGATTAKEYLIGNYKTKGGVGIAISNLLFVTGLKNNKVYTDSLNINGKKQLRAILPSTNQYSWGLGVNAELSFRTCCLVRPTINVGLFVPFSEETSPFFALGAGFNMGNRNVKFSMSAGLALGAINGIPERYRDKDLGQFGTLTNEDLTEKVLGASWHAAIGVSYNLAEIR